MDRGFALIAVGMEHDFGARFCGLTIGDGGYVAREIEKQVKKR